MANSNCLQGFECPSCHSEEPFRIRITASAVVYDSGIDDIESTEWDNSSYCECPACRFCGTAEDFQQPSHPTTHVEFTSGVFMHGSAPPRRTA